MTGTSKIPVSHPSVAQADPAHPLPFVVEARPEAANIPLDELLDWMKENSTWREEQLHRAGAILFRGFSALRTAEDFSEVAQRMALGLRMHVTLSGCEAGVARDLSDRENVVVRSFAESR